MPGGGDIYIKTANVILDESDIKSFTVDAGRYIRISVSDSGIGMDEAIRKKIFEPFFSKRESDQGFGLGLADLSKYLVKRERALPSISIFLPPKKSLLMKAQIWNDVRFNTAKGRFFW